MIQLGQLGKRLFSPFKIDAEAVDSGLPMLKITFGLSRDVAIHGELPGGIFYSGLASHEDRARILGSALAELFCSLTIW
jgi:hypothetical protein